MKHLTRLALFLALLVAAATPAAAQQGGPRQAFTVTATNRTAAQAPQGQRRDDRARPGDLVRYRLVFTNVTPGAVRGVTLANPLAPGMRFVGGSARADRTDARLEYSADGGRTFSAQPMEEVVVDGQRVRRPVAPERYTHVRWTVDGNVAPGATVVAEFDARVGAGTPAPATSGR
ncbi:hypothetical protein [Longimicrobium sp.]|uniref:hypothetical protein n=1 Tax=Longimicrobium sp. TaxID=2029185 RepID=UPI002E36F838|nr:hypothetical protein [Longimicrobium sp.]HEX6036958.1 hypothetical protein [Longimicrobium sp.]